MMYDTKLIGGNGMKRSICMLIALCSMLVVLLGCQHEPVVYAERIEIVKELPAYYCLIDSSKLISPDDLEWEAVLFNSEEEVKAYFSDAFLQAYPDYLKVDFSKYTLLVRTYFDFMDYDKRIFTLTKNSEGKMLYFHVSYVGGNMIADKPTPVEVYVERLAFVVEKLNEDYSVKTIYSSVASE